MNRDQRIKAVEKIIHKNACYDEGCVHKIAVAVVDSFGTNKNKIIEAIEDVHEKPIEVTYEALAKAISTSDILEVSPDHGEGER